ncbi:hypothetical protein XENTR_v10010120 [Xenopus tropicalis]|nr:hypothetical protein XENTR_v10010120 [Xenopus tropicalis]
MKVLREGRGVNLEPKWTPINVSSFTIGCRHFLSVSSPPPHMCVPPRVCVRVHTSMWIVCDVCSQIM